MKNTKVLPMTTGKFLGNSYYETAKTNTQQ
jgi:hypothetical protein